MYIELDDYLIRIVTERFGMNGFEYNSIVSRIEHYDQMARKMAAERRQAVQLVQPVAPLAVTGRPGDPVRLPDEKSA